MAGDKGGRMTLDDMLDLQEALHTQGFDVPMEAIDFILNWLDEGRHV